MDNNEHAELIEKCMEALRKVMRESTETYVAGTQRTDWTIIADCSYGGAYMALKDWNNSYVDLSRVREENRWQDLGTVMASYSTEFFTLEQIANMMVQAIITFENE